MNISPETRRKFCEELRFVARKIDETEDPVQKLFYYSASFGVTQRIYNDEYDSELVFIHYVLNGTHREFTTRLRGIKDARDTAVPLGPEHFEKLTQLTRELSDQIEGDHDVRDTLKNFVILAYTTTGNGYYLSQKGVLKI
jgi:hypothetical protein